MMNFERGDRDAADIERLALLVLDEDQIEIALGPGRVGVERLRERDKPVFDALRPHHNQRPRPVANILGIEQEPREPAEVIPMQMRDKDCVHLVEADPQLAHADQSGGAAVDEEPRRVGADIERSLEAAAGAERVATANNRYLHGPPS